MTGGNARAAQAQGLPVGWLMVVCCVIAGACAGLAGFFEVAAIHGQANASLVAGYGFTGILVAFLARHNPLAIMPVAILFGAIAAAGGLIQRRMGMPDATVLVLQGIMFVVLLVSETLLRPLQDASSPATRGPRHDGQCARHRPHRHARRRHPRLDAVHVRRARRMPHREIRAASISASRASSSSAPWSPTPISYHHRHPVARRARRRRSPALVLGALHGYICKLPKVNDIAIGIAMMLLRHRPRLLLRQALHPAHGAAARRHPARRLDRQLRAGAGAAGQPAVLRRHRARRRSCGGRSRNTAGA